MLTRQELDELLDRVRLGSDQGQENPRRRIWLAAALLPIPQRSQREMVRARELVLCLARALADRRHVDWRRHFRASRVAIGMRDRVIEPGRDLIEGALHSFLLRLSVSVLVSAARALRSPLVR